MCWQMGKNCLQNFSHPKCFLGRSFGRNRILYMYQNTLHFLRSFYRHCVFIIWDKFQQRESGSTYHRLLLGKSLVRLFGFFNCPFPFGGRMCMNLKGNLQHVFGRLKRRCCGILVGSISLCFMNPCTSSSSSDRFSTKFRSFFSHLKAKWAFPV